MSRKRRKVDAARIAAAKVIRAVTFDNAFSNESAAFHLASPELDARDKSFASAIIYGTLSYLPTIDYFIAKASSRPLEALEPSVLTALRMGVWQLFFSYHVPSRAAVDESVNVARFFSGERATGFVNAVLRKLTRQKPELPKGEQQALELGLSRELFTMLAHWYGEEDAIAIGRHSLTSPDYMSIRMNAMKADLFERWTSSEEAKTLQLRQLPWPDCAYGVEPSGTDVTQSQAYRDGLFSLQSQSAMLVGLFSRVLPDDRVLDLCAAPGGKLMHIAELKGNVRDLVACDQSEERLLSLTAMAERLGFGDIEQHCLDATLHHDLFNDAFDIVLCDVPCTGLGLLQKRPEIRSRVTAQVAERLLPIQRSILANGSRAVVVGGLLIYSTCTINPDENEEQVKAFLASKDGEAFELIHFNLASSVFHGDDTALQSRLPGTLLLLPHLCRSDGFFIALMRRMR
ncbi:MAG TPA: 16S rRNA (cytosine(967)-C(5))-methyltransferase RsmB [Clostridiaceae bacterium]|nr:16S rRNA (cytosine(967)-C(5))-methyltransferase RsmB [Clostridiaceae bacterium]